MRQRLTAIWLESSALVCVCGQAEAQERSDRAVTPTAPQASPIPANTENSTDDIIVTAQKREQRLIEVPQSISVVSGDALEQRQATSFADYVGLVPGLSLQQGNPGNTRVVLRGINTGSASPTVAIYVDDTPFGSSTSQTNGALLAGDFDTFDIDRVEVLRGPQGTLYGANLLGGVIKYVTTSPKLGVFEARGQAGVAAVDSGGTNWSGNGAVNVPLGDSLALRASGFYRRSAGFIDAIGRPGKDVNRADSYGGRASLLFKPSNTFSIRLTGLAQNIRADSRAVFDADSVTLDPISRDPVTGAPISGLVRTQNFSDSNNVDYRVYTGTLNWDFGFANLTSVTSYSDLRRRESTDVSYPDVGGLTLGDLGTSIYGSEVPLGVTQPALIRQKKFTQEVRLTSGKSDAFEWLIGGYITREPGKILQRYFPFDVASGQILPEATTLAATRFPTLVTVQLDSVYKEYAGFGSVTVHFGPRFDLTGGARYSHNRGYLPMGGQIVEIWPENPAEAAQKDTDARWTVKFVKARPLPGGRPGIDIAIPSFGYKSSTAICRRYGFIRSAKVTDGARFNGRMLRDVVTRDNTASDVWADTAYRSQANEAWLRSMDRVSRIHRKKPRGKPMSRRTSGANAKRSVVRARVEHVFARQKDQMGLFIRTIGIARAEAKITFANLVYNIDRLIFHERQATTG